MKKLLLLLVISVSAQAETIDEMYSRLHRESDANYNSVVQQSNQDEMIRLQKQQNSIERSEASALGVNSGIDIHSMPYTINPIRR